MGSGVIPDAADPTETGLATASLSEALGPPRNGATEDGRLASFLDHAADDLPCAMRVAGDRAEAFWGGNEDLADLAERAAPVLDLLLDADTETSRTLAHGGLLCLSGPDDRALLVCVDVSGFVLTLAPAEAVGRLARAWAAAGG